MWFVNGSIKKTNEKPKTNIDFYKRTNNGLEIHIDGYVLPRIKYYPDYSRLDQYSLIDELYKKYDLDFIKYIKGVFIIVLRIGEKYIFFNDRHNIKKYYIYNNEDIFLISNDLKFISTNYKLTISPDNIAIFCLFNHFIGGYSLYDEVKYIEPASQLTIFAGKITIKQYWSPAEILKKRETINISQLTEIWEKVISSYIDYFKPGKVTVTLTGGVDSRLVLASLINMNIKISTFSYGYPLSADVLLAKTIAKKVNIEHKNYFLKTPTEDWFRLTAEEIVQEDPFIHIHRVHRYDAIKKCKRDCYDSKMVFTGLLGGEYLKEPKYNDITIPRIFKDILKKNKSSVTERINNALIEKGFVINNIDINSIYQKLITIVEQHQSFNNKEKKFLYTYYFYGCSHHSQDSFIYQKYFGTVVNPFMDIDFLCSLVKIPRWYVKNKLPLFNKIFHSYTYVKMTDSFAPQLSYIPYVKKGSYSANDLLKRPILYIVKRIFTYKKTIK